MNGYQYRIYTVAGAANNDDNGAVIALTPGIRTYGDGGGDDDDVPLPLMVS
jgi:hypothetical protein